MHDQPEPEPHPDEERLLALWRLAEGRVGGIDKAAQPIAWQLAAGDAWRAQMAYRDAVTDRLRHDEAEDRVRRNRLVRNRRARRGSPRVGGL